MLSSLSFFFRVLFLVPRFSRLSPLSLPSRLLCPVSSGRVPQVRRSVPSALSRRLASHGTVRESRGAAFEASAGRVAQLQLHVGRGGRERGPPNAAGRARRRRRRERRRTRRVGRKQFTLPNERIVAVSVLLATRSVASVEEYRGPGKALFCDTAFRT